MWHERTHRASILNASATEPPFPRVPSSFTVPPPFGPPHSTIPASMFAGPPAPRQRPPPRFPPPASSAALPHSTSALPICSSVFAGSTPLGRSLGRTFTPLP